MSSVNGLSFDAVMFHVLKRNYSHTFNGITGFLYSKSSLESYFKGKEGFYFS